MKISKMFGAAMIAGALSVPMATTAAAQPPIVVGGGLVNVQVTDVLNGLTVTVEDINVTVGVALNLAANVCDVSVNVIADQLKTGGAECDNLVDGTGQIVTINR